MKVQNIIVGPQGIRTGWRMFAFIALLATGVMVSMVLIDWIMPAGQLSLTSRLVLQVMVMTASVLLSSWACMKFCEKKSLSFIKAKCFVRVISVLHWLSISK